MKLVKIKDVRIGQIYYKDGEYRVIVGYDDEPNTISGNSLYHAKEEKIVLVEDYEDELSIDEIVNTHLLLGFIGITHTIEDNHLIQRVRRNYEVDDVVKYWSGHINNHNQLAVVVGVNDDYPTKPKLTDGILWFQAVKTFEVVGQLGVTHEFINDRLVK